MPEDSNSVSKLQQTLEILAQLLGENGCSWTKAQTHETLAQYAVEEAYELVDAISAGNQEEMIEELGDLWLQVAYHSSIAQNFDIDDVATVLNDKLIRRHPHVFADGDAKSQSEIADKWDEIKASEKKNRTDPFEGVSKDLPPLLSAYKIRWRGRDKIPLKDKSEALQKLKDIVTNTQEDTLDSEQIGVILGSVVDLCASLETDPDMALRKNNQGYMARVRES